MSTPAPGPGPSGPSASSASRTPHVPLSILDLVPISEGMDAREAIGHAMSSAQLADRLGFTRYWFAEHHNTISLASNATSLLIGQAAQLTERIRVGSGGVMLPNHSPLSVIEQFGTLVQMHGDRIDLGLGRAPGTDPLTAQLLARTSAEPEAFIAAVEQMRDWSRSEQPTGLRIAAPVAEGTEVAMWILGSTSNGAQLAGRLGMPFSVASHFSPFGVEQALDAYRRTFDADAESAQTDAAHTMVGVNVLVAPTDEEAQHLFTSAQQGFLGILRGERTKVKPPRDLEGLADPALLAKVDQTLSVRAVGSPRTVVAQLESIVRATGADELIVTGQIFDPAHRDRSHELLAQAWGL
ncbi:LLM class flavin-dependent oxidoreductase [Brachybacterium sp. MASK1Z-5]|uniref:LLM class flavin-dependent oxidoreductase n=1 Tax=Brachybacterium halotolerans TaxID=2795215 RepID=A0ABS1BD42_9MICO|nr:LLM class flavin-dependent oxidoreductase [Brachybacterium halotolerans]MBK0332538.1 LLM class flavin-dependent oxidoreductase [Brachybacterium halotolerans]